MANNDNVVSVLLEHIARHLQSDTNNSTQEKNRGRTILMILYLCVLAMCFITPIIYYIRLRCEERRAHRLGQLEAEGMAVALEESQQQQRQETRAVWRKYVEERRARLKQLFRPVQLILKEEHFVREKLEGEERSDEEAPVDLKLANTSSTSTGDDGYETDGQGDNVDEEMGTKSQDPEHTENPYGEDEAAMIRIPVAGLHLTMEQRETRVLPGLCTICLCPYEVGSDVVWSSNSACEHVFHEECIERWLMKQREGPLCPCCRRDFVVDPYDLEDGGAYLRENVPEIPLTESIEEEMG